MTTNAQSLVYGLIGRKLDHSFSKKYFTNKFEKENIFGVRYELFPLDKVEDLKSLILNETGLDGLNVTIPYKESVIPLLDEMSVAAKQVGAVNTIRFDDGKLIGYNTDVIGFEQSLINFIEGENPIKIKVLILGTGGAAKAVQYVLDQLGLPFLTVSRTAGKADLIYADITNETLQEYKLIINTTPLGMAPDEDSCPEINYNKLSENNLLYDLVYNPEKTLFLEQGHKKGCRIKNGQEMLELQAEAAWKIWKGQEF